VTRVITADECRCGKRGFQQNSPAGVCSKHTRIRYAQSLRTGLAVFLPVSGHVIPDGQNHLLALHLALGEGIQFGLRPVLSEKGR
jgi:hypothetical protein